MATKQTSMQNDLEIKATRPADDVQDVVLNLERSKKRFRVDGDNAKIIELDVSDLSMITRFNESYPKLLEIEKDVRSIQTEGETDEKALGMLTTKLSSADTKMRELIDYIFDTNLCEIVSPTGTMYDPIDGMLRYERILDTFANLYATNIHTEVDKLKSRIRKHTNKYTTKR